MAAEHFAALVDHHRKGRTNSQIANTAGIPSHWLSIYLKPSTSIKTMPDVGRIGALARALGAPTDDVYKAFAADVTGTPARGGGADDIDPHDPQTKEMLRLWSGLDTHHRVTNIAMLRSLSTLQRRTTAIDARDNREVG